MQYTWEEISQMGLHESLVKDSSGVVFLNPLGIFQMSESMIELASKNLDENQEAIDSDPEISNQDKSFLKNMNNVTKSLLENMNKLYGLGLGRNKLNDLFDAYKLKVNEAIITHQGNQHIRTKYEWLATLLDWAKSEYPNDDKFTLFFNR